MSNRKRIVDAVVSSLRRITTNDLYGNTLYSRNVTNKNKFWDEVKDFPFICVVAGLETREYQPSSFSWGLLNVSLKLYTYGEDADTKLEALLSDVERNIDSNQTLLDGNCTNAAEVLITSIVTDEGLLAPYGIGEVNLQVRYPIIR